MLGLVEGGLFPGESLLILAILPTLIIEGAAVYLTLFYTKQELALRIGYLFVSAAIAGTARYPNIPPILLMSGVQELLEDFSDMESDSWMALPVSADGGGSS